MLRGTGEGLGAMAAKPDGRPGARDHRRRPRVPEASAARRGHAGVALAAEGRPTGIVKRKGSPARPGTSETVAAPATLKDQAGRQGAVEAGGVRPPVRPVAPRAAPPGGGAGFWGGPGRSTVGAARCGQRCRRRASALPRPPGRRGRQSGPEAPVGPRPVAADRGGRRRRVDRETQRSSRLRRCWEIRASSSAWSNRWCSAWTEPGRARPSPSRARPTPLPPKIRPHEVRRGLFFAEVSPPGGGCRNVLAV